MARTSGQKLKLLYLAKILSEETDEEHAISTQELIGRLEGLGIRSERKSIYDDIACLQQFGYDILQVQSRQGGGYYMASREFELAELKLLVDAVQSSRFITPKKQGNSSANWRSWPAAMMRGNSVARSTWWAASRQRMRAFIIA